MYYIDMNNADFLSHLNTKFPDAAASLHGAVGGSRTKQSVSVVFTPGGRSYDYSGSYVSILCHFGIGPEWHVVCPNGEYCGRYWTEAEAQTACTHQEAEAVRIGLSLGYTVLHGSGE
jgi:hypothetical protein